MAATSPKLPVNKAAILEGQFAVGPRNISTPDDIYMNVSYTNVNRGA